MSAISICVTFLLMTQNENFVTLNYTVIAKEEFIFLVKNNEKFNLRRLKFNFKLIRIYD